MRTILFLSLFIVYVCESNFCCSQGFQRLFGSTGNDICSSISTLPNGDYIVTGTTRRAGTGNDIYIARIDTSGSVIWENTYGGIGNEGNSISCINNNGNIIIAANSLSYNAGRDLDIFLFEITPDGSLMWARSFGKGTSASRLDEIPRKINLSSTGLILCATIGIPSSNSPDILVLEFSNNGQSINWQNQISSNFGDIPSSIIPSRNGGYIMVGGSFTTLNNYDQVIWRLNGSGGLSSNIAFGGNNNENAQDVIELPNNDIVVMGNFRGLSGVGLEFSLCNIRSNNTFNWIRTYGDNGTNDERAYGLIQTTNGYAFCGYTNGVGGRDILVVWTNMQGNLLGNTSIGGSGLEESSSLVQNFNGGFTISGFSNSSGAGLNDCYLVKTNSTGRVVGNCSSYPIVERTVTTNIRSYSYSQANPLLSNFAIIITTMQSSLNNTNLICPTLPLDLLDFQVSSKNYSNVITWVTLNESNLSHFEIEKSSNGNNWEVVKLVKSEGGIAMKKSYEFLDSEISNQFLYYRLKQVNYNGDYFYSNSIKVYSSSNDYFVYPNPVKDYLTLHGAGFTRDSIISVLLQDLNGTECLNGNLNMRNLNASEVVFDLRDLDIGFYMLSLICKDKKVNIKIVKE